MIRSMMGRKKVDRNTLLLLHFDGSLKDEASGKPYVASPYIQTIPSIFGLN